MIEVPQVLVALEFKSTKGTMNEKEFKDKLKVVLPALKEYAESV